MNDEIFRRKGGTLKILIVGSFRYEMYASAFSYGFRKLGHEVVELDYNRYKLSEGNPLFRLLNRIQDRFHYGLKMRAYNRAIINVVENDLPNLVFFYRCYHVYTSTLEKIRGKCLIMSYNNDDPFSGVPSRNFFRHYISNVGICDIVYAYRKKNIKDLANIGVYNTKVLLPYYRENANYYDPTVQKSEPLAFLGHFENDGRDGYIKALIDAGLPVKVYGGGLWKRAPLYDDIKDVVSEKQFGPDYNKKLNQCQIALVFLSKLNHDTYTRRCFEIPAAKTLMVCEYTEDMDSMFPENECAVYFRSKEELVTKCKELLDNPEEISRIAENGYNRLKEIGGSEVDRCKEIVEAYRKIYTNNQ